MKTRACLAAILFGIGLTAVAAAVPVMTPQGPVEVFSRADLFDMAEILRLTGAEVGFSAAAGSYTAILDEREVQFTPGGTLAVVDGRLVPLPGPIRVLEDRPVATMATANALLAPIGWSLRGSPAAPQLVPMTAAPGLEVSLTRTPTGTLVVSRGSSLRPRMDSSPGQLRLTYGAPVRLAAPPPGEGEVLGAEARDTSLLLRLAPGVEAVSTYPLEDPPRYVVRLAATAPAAELVTRRVGPLVVLDPGHGGEDHGARGPGGELEKDIVLAVARMTGARLQAAGIEARLTREGDENLSLQDRTALANRLRADVFVSIHANASTARGARGAETYFMSADASDPVAAQAAATENLEASPDTVQLILWDLAHVANLSASSRLARAIQGRLNMLQGIRDRGVRQAPFVVLTGATMPAALVEIGFLSNREEASRLTGRPAQEAIAAALTEAIISFLRTPAGATESEP